MKKLFLLRHGKAGFGTNDHSRPLAPQGKQDILWLGQYLKTSDMLPDHIFCSSALRTRETCTQMLDGAEETLPVTIRDDLYHATTEGMTRLIQKLDQEIVAPMIIAHNPGLASLFQNLAQHSRQVRDNLSFQTGTLAIITFDIDDWSELQNHSGQVMRVIIPPRITKNVN